MKPILGLLSEPIHEAVPVGPAHCPGPAWLCPLPGEGQPPAGEAQGQQEAQLMEGGEHHQEQGGGAGHPGWIQEADCQQGGKLRGVGGQVQRLQLC